MFWRKKVTPRICKGESVTLVRVVFVFNNSSCHIDYWVNDKYKDNKYLYLKRYLSVAKGCLEQNGKIYKIENFSYIYCFDLAKGKMKEDVNWDFYKKDIIGYLVEDSKS